jgi:L-alanine-DL-glutamate epimerase-like enolase superfamily enzyme
MAITKNHIVPDANGILNVPDSPGLGVEPDLPIIAPYLVEAEIRVRGKQIYTTPSLR